MYFGPSQEKRFRLRICLAVLKFIKIRIDACLVVLQSASIHMDWEGLWWKKKPMDSQEKSDLHSGLV
jgi:hypothetical protein